VATPVVMPKLGLTMREGTVRKWLKAEGAPVRKGEPLFEVMTEKVTVVVEALASGILRHVLVREGGKVPVGAPVGVIADADEDISALLASLAPTGAETAVGRLRVSPRARKLAEQHGIDLSLVTGSGPGGRIVEADVERALAERMAQLPPRKVLRKIPYDGIRRTIGERLGQSHTTAVPVTLTTEVDMTELLALRARLNEGVPKRDEISVTALIVKAAAQALKRHPRLNSSLDGDEIVEWGEIHVGVAVALEDGLLVPVVRDADQKTVGQINADIRELARKAEKGALGPDEVTGSTFTVTNLGMYGVDAFTPVINPPEAAILGVGRTVSRPELRDGQLVLRQVATLSLTFDHRLADGAPAAQFLSSLRESLERPYGLVR